MQEGLKVKIYGSSAWIIMLHGLLPRITFPIDKITRKRKADKDEPVTEKKEIIVEPHMIPNRGPYPYNKPKM